jgi:hypothetical protein
MTKLKTVKRNRVRVELSKSITHAEYRVRFLPRPDQVTIVSGGLLLIAYRTRLLLIDLPGDNAGSRASLGRNWYDKYVPWDDCEKGLSRDLLTSR